MCKSWMNDMSFNWYQQKVQTNKMKFQTYLQRRWTLKSIIDASNDGKQVQDKKWKKIKKVVEQTQTNTGKAVSATENRVCVFYYQRIKSIADADQK